MIAAALQSPQQRPERMMHGPAANFVATPVMRTVPTDEAPTFARIGTRRRHTCNEDAECD